ncbi:hypothetical protein [Erythrobacter sp.]|jgi:hypothetical protein|uniref:hypothetical protein n=1 Tax=Erythrobacter sp. TaxID=1042 RepID=UPI002EC99662|nr:hypothetical protein [Erythrobacter sp.]
MIARGDAGWQLILADLALILFLLVLAALAGQTLREEAQAAPAIQAIPALAPSQALYRETPGGPQLGEWLSRQTADVRATLTIVAHHTPEDAAAIWERARRWSDAASETDFAVRVIVRRGQTSDIYASLAYDDAVERRGVATS